MLYVVKEYLPTTDYLTCIDKCIILTTTQIAIIGGWCRVSRHMAWLAEHPALLRAARHLKEHTHPPPPPPGAAQLSTHEMNLAEWADNAVRRRGQTRLFRPPRGAP